MRNIIILTMIIAITLFVCQNVYFLKHCSGLANTKWSRAEEKVAPGENFSRKRIDPNIDPNSNDNSNVTLVLKGKDGFLKIVCFVELVNLRDYVYLH